MLRFWTVKFTIELNVTLAADQGRSPWQLFFSAWLKLLVISNYIFFFINQDDTTCVVVLILGQSYDSQWSLHVSCVN